MQTFTICAFAIRLHKLLKLAPRGATVGGEFSNRSIDFVQVEDLRRMFREPGFLSSLDIKLDYSFYLSAEARIKLSKEGQVEVECRCSSNSMSLAGLVGRIAMLQSLAAFLGIVASTFEGCTFVMDEEADREEDLKASQDLPILKVEDLDAMPMGTSLITPCGDRFLKTTTAKGWTEIFRKSNDGSLTAGQVLDKTFPLIRKIG